MDGGECHDVRAYEVTRLTEKKEGVHVRLTERNKRNRPDGVGKVTGELKYLTDLSFPGMLFGKILRSSYPHANILSICTERAKKLPGVRAVVTHADVPGMNRFGIVIPDQPVLCEEKVRYTGDAIAAVAAETEEIAERALKLIEVVYDWLPEVDDPEKALLPDAPQLHPGGNVLHRSSYQKGDMEEGFKKCAVVSLEESHTIKKEDLYSRHKHSLYVNHTFPCRIMGTFSKGNLVYARGKRMTGISKGEWIKGKKLSYT